MRIVLGLGLGLGLGRGRALGALVVAAGLLAAACGGSGGNGPDRPGATVPDGGSGSSSAPSSTTTSGGGGAAIDITAKPDTITVEYADAVMDELDRILSDAIREFVAADGPTKGFDDKLNAVYDEPSLENARQEYGEAAVDGMDDFKDPPGDVATTVKEILKVEQACVVMAVERTFAATLVAPNPAARRTSFIAWEPTDPDGDPGDLNATPWSIVFDGNVLEGEEPRNAC